jgi:hypothetical protein
VRRVLGPMSGKITLIQLNLELYPPRPGVVKPITNQGPGIRGRTAEHPYFINSGGRRWGAFWRVYVTIRYPIELLVGVALNAQFVRINI